jgi:hypothetical protein
MILLLGLVVSGDGEDPYAAGWRDVKVLWVILIVLALIAVLL